MTAAAALRRADPTLGFDLGPERAEDAAAIERLLDGAFGPGRFAKASERVRERLGVFDAGASRVARSPGGALVGCCRIWRVGVGAGEAAFLGPLAVDPAARSLGLGAALVEACLAAAAAAGQSAVLVIGAATFFAPLGFAAIPRDRIVFPAPVEPARAHWRALAPGGLEGLGGALSRPPGATPA